MKKNGFTLAELLGVITILALLALIVVPVVDKTLKDGKEELYSAQIESIEAAAQMWGTDHIDLLPGNSETKMITLSTLQDAGYIAVDIEDPRTGRPFSPTLQIKITSQGAYYTYEVIPE